MQRIIEYCLCLITSPKFRRPLRWALVILLLAGACTTAQAQYRLDHYTTSNGLPQNTVSAITQTRDGYLWFATYDGLVRYDGVNFTIFDKGNAAGLSSHQFLALCEDGRGTLWAGTSDGGLIRYRDGAFNSFTTKQGLPTNFIGRIQRAEDGLPIIFFDVGEKNYLQWTKNNSLASLNIFLWMEDNSLVPIEERPLHEYIDRSKTRWVLEKNSLLRFKGDQQTSFPITLTPDEFLRFRYEDRAGNMWFCTKGRGVYQIAGENLRHYTDQDGVPSNEIIRIGGEDSAGHLWFFCEKRLMRYKNGQFTVYSSQEVFASNNIRSVFCDREGTIWVGTNERGLYRLTRQFLTTYSERDGLLNNIVYPIYEDRTGNIWMGSGSGMTRFVGGNFIAYPLTSASKQNRSKVVIAMPTEKQARIAARSLCEDREGRLWIGIERGLLTFKDGSVVDNSKMVNYLSVDTMIQDRAGNMWIGTEKGLFKERAGVITVYTTKEGLPNEQVTIIYEDKQGTLWVGTRGGLARFEGDRFVSFTATDGLVGDRIRSLYEDTDGALWIGTFDSGLSRLKAGQFTNYTTRTGLFNNGVFQILEDRRGNFWISSNRGIYRVSRKQLNDYADGKVTVINCVGYGIQDGMLSVECNGGLQPAGIKARDGKFWFPNQNGVVVIDPDVVPHNLHPPQAIIELVKIDRADVGFHHLVQLEPGQRGLEINYTAPSSIKAEYIQFKYKLEGLEDEWVEAGARRTAYYPHLPAGRYRFKVIAASGDGVWNETGATLEIYMKPYFYQTGWFFALCAIGIMAVAASIYARRVQQLKANEKRLTEQVLERTAELFERTEQLEVANGKLEQLASLDGLTNIANRRRFTEFLTQEWQRSQRSQTPLSLLMMDVDYFKPYNDTYGHQGGDECLKQVAAVLRETTNRSTDLAARYGGEEFVVVLSDTDKQGALVVAETIRAQIEALEIPHSGSKVNPYVTLSIGVATIIPDRNTDADDLIAAADHSLYRAKENGRNRCWTEIEVWA